MDTAKLFKLVGRNIVPHHLGLKEEPRQPYAHRDFDKLRVDFPELGGYFPVPGTLN